MLATKKSFKQIKCSDTQHLCFENVIWDRTATNQIGNKIRDKSGNKSSFIQIEIEKWGLITPFFIMHLIDFFSIQWFFIFKNHNSFLQFNLFVFNTYYVLRSGFNWWTVRLFSRNLWVFLNIKVYYAIV